jgi:hypothetical protein
MQHGSEVPVNLAFMASYLTDTKNLEKSAVAMDRKFSFNTLNFTKSVNYNRFPCKISLFKK